MWSERIDYTEAPLDAVWVAALGAYHPAHRVEAIHELRKRVVAAEVRNRKLERKLVYRARVIGGLRATVKLQWNQVVAAEAKATRWQNLTRSLTGWSTPIHPKDTP